VWLGVWLRVRVVKGRRERRVRARARGVRCILDDVLRLVCSGSNIVIVEESGEFEMLT